MRLGYAASGFETKHSVDPYLKLKALKTALSPWRAVARQLYRITLNACRPVTISDCPSDVAGQQQPELPEPYPPALLLGTAGGGGHGRRTVAMLAASIHAAETKAIRSSTG